MTTENNLANPTGSAPPGDVVMQGSPEVNNDKKKKENEKFNFEEFVQARNEHLYAYILGKNSANWTEEEKAGRLKQEQENDLKTYREVIGNKPEGMTDEDWTKEETKRLFWAKNLAIVAYAVDMGGASDEGKRQELEAKVDAAEQAEDMAEIVAEDRPLDMSDSEWSDHKAKLMKERADPEEEDRDMDYQMDLQRQGADDAEDVHAEKIKLETEVKPLNKDALHPALRAVYTRMVPIIWNWWDNEVSEKDREDIAKLNLHIIKNGGHSSKDCIAPTETEWRLKRVQEWVAKCESSPSDETRMTLVGLVISLTNHLRSHNLDWKMIASKTIHARVLEILDGSESSNVIESTKRFENAFFEVATEQKQILDRVNYIIPHIVEGFDKKNGDHVNVGIEQLRNMNEALGKVNTASGYKRADHNFPVTDLEAWVKHMTHPEWPSLAGALAYKMEILQIPGSDEIQEFMKRHGVSYENINRLKVRHEVLGLIRSLQIEDRVEDVPPLDDVSASRLAYPTSVEQKTVAWGHQARTFFINQYGPKHAPVWRKEEYPTESWTQEFGHELPIELKVTNPLNRMGDDLVSPDGKRRWGKEHVAKIYGVAFEEDPTEYGEDERVEVINPENHEDGEPWGKALVLVGWDRHGNGIDIEKRWETRSAVRNRFGIKKADRSIYDYACASQKRFDRWHKHGDAQQHESEGAPVVDSVEFEDAVAAAKELKERQGKKKSKRSRHARRLGRMTRSRQSIGGDRQEAYHMLRDKMDVEEIEQLLRLLGLDYS